MIYAPVDEDTRLTLRDMQKEWIKAHSIQDFEKVMSIGKDIKTLLGVGNDILKLKRELQLCVAQENYEKAIDIRNQLQANAKIRTNFDMVYETNRFEDMIAMGATSEQYIREENLNRMEEQREVERRRKQDQIDQIAKKLSERGGSAETGKVSPSWVERRTGREGGRGGRQASVKQKQC